MPLDLSLVIPSGGRTKALERTLVALAAAGAGDYLGQTVVVHRPGDVDTRSVIDTAGSSAWRLEAVAVEQPTGNAAIARNAGLARATAEHLLMLGNDIVVAPDFFRRLTEAVAHWPEAVILGRMDRAPGLDAAVWEPDPQLQRFAEGRYDRWPWDSFYTGLVCCQRAHLADGFRATYRGHGQEDKELGYRLFRRGLQFVYAPTVRGTHLAGGLQRPRPRHGQGLHADNIAYVHNVCRTMLHHVDDPAVVHWVAQTRFTSYRPGDDGQLIGMDRGTGDGYVVVARALRDFQRQYPDDPLVRRVNRVLANLRPHDRHRYDATAAQRQQLVIWPHRP